MIRSYIKNVRDKDDKSINKIALILALITTLAIVTLWIVLRSQFTPEREVQEEAPGQRTLQQDVQLLIQETQLQFDRLNTEPSPIQQEQQNFVPSEPQDGSNEQPENSIELSEQESTELMYTQ